jgi:putative SOS response-associated peptidase YedK
MPDNFNVSPGTLMPVIIRGTQKHRIEMMSWGLTPSWSDSSDKAYKLINARSENLSTKPAWKRLVQSNRCIVPARGFYEWKAVDGTKQPFYITPLSGDVMSFAGLYDHHRTVDGTVIMSFTIITTVPNLEMAEVHNRMPAILDKQKADTWLSPLEISYELLHDLLRPTADNSLRIDRVSTRVNYAGHNDKDLIYPLPD